MKLWRYGRAIEQLGQRYRLDGVLGSGGMADVCLAWDERSQREVAIKVIKGDELDQRALNRFLKEAAQVAQWRHPNILRIYGDVKLELLDANQGSIIPYIVMEYARGGDLHKRLKPNLPYDLQETFVIFAQICSAVAYAHEQHIIHRDLKPLNILFRKLENGTEQAVLSDFGLAVDVGATHFTFAGGGTLPYMAPEQLRRRARAVSDIFALGVILYQLLTGHLPFLRTIQNLHLPQVMPRPASQLNPQVPTALDDVIFKALSEDPALRYPDASSLWQAVYAVILATPALSDLLPELGGSTFDMTSNLLMGPAAATLPPNLFASLPEPDEPGQAAGKGRQFVIPRFPVLPPSERSHPSIPGTPQVPRYLLAGNDELVQQSEPRPSIANINNQAQTRQVPQTGHDVDEELADDVFADELDELDEELYSSDQEPLGDFQDSWLADSRTHLRHQPAPRGRQTGQSDPLISAGQFEPTVRRSDVAAEASSAATSLRRVTPVPWDDEDDHLASAPSQNSRAGARSRSEKTIILPETRAGGQRSAISTRHDAFGGQRGTNVGGGGTNAWRRWGDERGRRGDERQRWWDERRGKLGCYDACAFYYLDAAVPVCSVGASSGCGADSGQYFCAQPFLWQQC